jgi:methionyl-tRNA formyltransferase
MRILLFGSGPGGMRSLDALARQDAIVGVVTHLAPASDETPTDALHAHASGAGIPVARFAGRDAQLARFVRDLRPDLLWIAQYGYLLPQTVIDLAPLGAVNLHPSLLPSYRGRSSVHWAILRGERAIGLTAHCVDGGVDSGDVIAQRRVELAPHEDVGDALSKLEPLYAELSLEVVLALRRGNASRTPQAPGNWPIWPLRRAEDGVIDWSSDSQSVANLVRASARPYSGAVSWLAGGRVTIWRARAGLPRGPGSIGSVWRTDHERFFVNCGEGSLEVLDCEIEGARFPRVGDRLDPLERAA